MPETGCSLPKGSPGQERKAHLEPPLNLQPSEKLPEYRAFALLWVASQNRNPQAGLDRLDQVMTRAGLSPRRQRGRRLGDLLGKDA